MATDASPSPEPPESHAPSADDATPGPTVRNVPDDGLFEIVVDGARAGLTQYVEDSGQRIFYHTEVDDAHAGQGLAAILVRDALDATRADGLRIVPVCPYISVFVRRNHDWDDILDKVTPAAIEAIERSLA